MGEFNICLLKENENKYLILNNMFHRYYFNPMTTKPTRILDNCASIIDHIWVNIMNKTTSGIVVSHVTDHYFVFSSLIN